MTIALALKLLIPLISLLGAGLGAWKLYSSPKREKLRIAKEIFDLEEKSKKIMGLQKGYLVGSDLWNDLDKQLFVVLGRIHDLRARFKKIS